MDIPRPHLGDRIRIVLLGAENPDVIRGMYFDGVILDEFADMNPEVWSKIIRPALSDRMGWAIFIGTPKGMNHFYDVYMAALKRIAADSLDWFVALYKASQTGIISKSELDEARALMSEEEFEQEFECFPPGTLVCTNRGNIPIESVRLGDVVLTHKNRWHMVTRTMNKVFSGELVFIRSFLNSEKLYLTKEHPVLVYERKTQERKWVKAEDLREGDYVITPRANTFFRLVHKVLSFLNLGKVFPAQHMLASRVTEVGNASYKGKVYNLSVKQDESYVAGGIAVHNCSFSAALVSAYYGKAMAQAEDEGRITGVPHDPSVLVDTYWDLGINDTTVVWFGQRVGREMHWIDHIETSGKGLDEYVRDLKSGHRAKYTYGSYYLPHDAAARELGTGKTREETLRSLGLKNTIIVPRQSVADGINATRLLLAVSWFDKEKCERGIHALKNYQREWDSKNKIFRDTPKHDWASHSADAFRTAATSNYDKKKSITEASKLPRQADNSYDIW